MSAERTFRVMVAISFAQVSMAYELADLAGTWHVAGLDIPGVITQVKNGEGIVCGLNNENSFGVADGYLTIGPTGGITGTVGSSFTGTASVSAAGLVTLALDIVGEGTATFTLPITTNVDLMATANGASDYHELLLMAKEPTTAVLADVVGSWWVMELHTPGSLGLQYDPQDGKVTNVSNANRFSQRRKSLLIGGDGRYNFNNGEEFGQVAVSTNGAMTVTPDDPLESALQFHMNKGKDVMLRAHSSSEDRELIVLVKKHEVHNWEAAGRWTMSSLRLPGNLPVSYDNDGYVTDIGRLESFDHANGWIHFSLGGSLNGFLDEAFQGYSTSSSDGTLPIHHGGPVPFLSAVNAGGDFLVGVGDDSEDLEMIAAVRSVRPLEVAMSSAGVPKVIWVPAPGRYLEESSTLNANSWMPVAGSVGMSSYTPNLATEGSKHFYRLSEP